jgi:hypothetical protein
MLHVTQVSVIDSNDSMYLANIYAMRHHFRSLYIVGNTNPYENPTITYWELSSSSSSSPSPSSGVGVGRAGSPTLREGLADREGTGTAEREGRGEGVGRTEMTNERLTDGRLF